MKSICFKFSNARLVLSQCNARLRLLYLLNKDIGNDNDGSPFWSFTDLAQKQLILKEFSRWKNFLESPQNSCLAKFSHAESVVLIYSILQLNPYFFITPAITPFFLAEKSFPFLSFLQYIQKLKKNVFFRVFCQIYRVNVSNLTSLIHFISK